MKSLKKTLKKLRKRKSSRRRYNGGAAAAEPIPGTAHAEAVRLNSMQLESPSYVFRREMPDGWHNTASPEQRTEYLEHIRKLNANYLIEQKNAFPIDFERQYKLSENIANMIVDKTKTKNIAEIFNFINRIHTILLHLTPTQFSELKIIINEKRADPIKLFFLFNVFEKDRPTYYNFLNGIITIGTQNI